MSIKVRTIGSQQTFKMTSNCLK